MNGSSVDALNTPERALKLLSQFKNLVSTYYSTNLNAAPQQDDPQALRAGIIGDLASQTTRVPQDLQVALEFIQTARNKGLTNDKKYLVEHIIQLAASLPSDSPSLRLISSKFVEQLWNNLEHPPLTYLGDEWRYRTANGSNNNRMYPWLGKAGSPYARTVRPQTVLPPTLPDAGLIFDELFAREGKGRTHPNKVSSTLFYLASIIIHDVFRTEDKEWNNTANSSYLDLSPLYGNSQHHQDQIRTKKDGMLHPDTFAEVRLLGFPPGVCSLLVCFSRFHNYIAGELATINEGGRFTLMGQKEYDLRMPEEIKKRYPTPELKRDNDLFQTARLITCGLYVNIILNDYVRTILDMNATHSEWTLDPRANIDKIFGQTGVPDGIGNQVSVEFNLVYRWHSAVSEADARWTSNFLRDEIGVDPKKFTYKDLGTKFAAWFEKEEKTKPQDRTFGNLKRQENGAFKDEDLVNLLTAGTKDVAGAFGARNVPTVLKVIEMLGIEQARSWNVATLNEFRKFFGMIPHKDFTDISTDPEVARSLETLYGHPDYVELYPGLVAEDAKAVMQPGSGLCPGFTISRAILADAVALVRGDRFYTQDFTAASLTNWGFNEIASNKQISGGGVMYKLLMRALPGFYRSASIYAMYPFTTPERTHEMLRGLGLAKEFDFSEPKYVPQPTAVSSWKATVHILKDQEQFKVPWGPHTRYLTGHGYMLSGDSPADAEQKVFVGKALYSPANGLTEIRGLYERITRELIEEHGRNMRSGYQIDLIADIANNSHAIAIAKLFHIPLKLPGNTEHLLTPQTFYTIVAILFAYVFLDLDTANSFQLRAAAKQSAELLDKIVEAVVVLVQHNYLGKLKEWFSWGKHDDIPDYGAALIKRLLARGKSVSDTVAVIVPTIAAAVATQAQGLSLMMDLLLREKYSNAWHHIQELARSDDPASYDVLERYALECYRINTPDFGLIRDVAAPSVHITDHDKHITVHKGERVFVNFVTASMDPSVFLNPEEIRLDRDMSKYVQFGQGPHSCLGRPIVITAMAAQLKVLGKLQGLRRAPGLQGHIKKKVVNGVFSAYMTPDWSSYFPFPTTMKVMYDGFVE